MLSGISPCRLVAGRVVMVFAIVALLASALPVRPAIAEGETLQFSTICCVAPAAAVNTRFAEDPMVAVLTVSQPWATVGGVPVTFSVPSTGASGTFSNGQTSITVTSKTDGVDKGTAYAGPFTANGIIGTYSMTVSTPGALSVTYPFSNVEDPASKANALSIGSGSPQSAQINTAFPLGLTVAVFNGLGQPLSGVVVTYTAPASGPSGTFANGTRTTTATTDGTGQATASTFTANGITSPVGEPYRVEVSISGAQTATGQPLLSHFSLRNTTTNANGVPEMISVSGGAGQTGSVLTPFPVRFNIAIFDGSQLPVSGATVTFTAPSSGPSGTFQGGSTTYTTTTDSTGVVLAPTFTANDVPGAYKVVVTATKNSVTATIELDMSNGKVATTTALAAQPSGSSVYGQPVVLRATITPQFGSLSPSGRVAFKSSGTTISGCTSVAPSNGVATCTLNNLAKGSHSFSADYQGDSASFSSSSSTVSHTVNAASTSIALSSSATPFALHGNSVTFTATLSVTAPGGGTPTGGITFTSSDGTLLNGGNPVALVNGQASVTTSALATGSPTITATYAGDTNFNGSTQTLTQNVYTGPVVTDDPDDALIVVGNQASFSATASGVPTPTVQWQVSTDGGDTFTNIGGATSTTYSFTVSASDQAKQYRAVFTNAAGSATSAPATLTVRQAPAIVSGNEATFTVGEEGSFSVAATGILAPTLSLSGDLPSGVTFSAETGLFSGTPAVGTGGAYVVTITASNGIEPDAVQTFTLHVQEPPAITSPNATTFEVGELGNFSFIASGYPEATFSTSDPLPGGVTLTAGGLLSGTPTEHGVFVLTVVATNGVGEPASQTFTLTVNEAPAITSADTATFEVGVAGTHTFTTTGYPEVTVSLSGPLPAGVTFDAQSGVLSGTPEDGTGGSYTLTVTATNGVTTDASQSFTLIVNESPEITSADTVTFVVGQSGSFSVTASGFPAATFSAGGSLPQGLTLSSNGVLAGTPADGTGGVYSIQITASNGIAPSATQTITLTINESPEITSGDAVTFVVGESDSFTVTASGFPAATFATDGPLPQGVSLTSEGTLAGTPADGMGGVYQIDITASNGIAPSATQSFTLTINESPAITSGDETTFVVGQLGSFTVTADGFPAATFTVSGDLPAGVSLSSDGTLSGTPADGTGGVYPIEITASNGIAPSATQTFTLTIDESPEITSGDEVTFVVGQPGSFTVLADGFPAATFTVSGDLPDGVSLSSAGTLSGTPADGSGGTYALVFTASNGVTPDAQQSFTLTVNESPEFTSAQEATFIVGQLGSFTVQADGFPGATFTTDGPLPAGVSLGNDGLLSGTPADGTGGVYTFVITAANGIAPDVTQTFTLTIDEAPGITSADTVTFVVGQEASFTVTTDGYPDASINITGALPAGVSAGADGVISGTPADGTGGVYPLTITATNGVIPDATQAFTLIVHEAPEVTSAAETMFVLGEFGSFSVTATGYPAVSFSAIGALPSGVILAPDGTLSGTPATGTAGEYVVTITASNGVAPNATQTFTLEVVPPAVIAPDDITVENAPGQAGAMVTYPAPTSIGNVGTITCTPPSGDFFPIGATTVTCSSTSGLSDTLVVTVLDTEFPALQVPANISVDNAPGQHGAVVNYPAPVVSDNAPGVTFNCVPPAGTFFAIGTTTVTCTATDAAGNVTTGRFTVTVLPTTQLLLDDLRQSTITLVTHDATERALLATLARVQQYVNARNPLLAYFTMLQFVVQVDHYADARRITPAAAAQLLIQAQLLTRSLM